MSPTFISVSQENVDMRDSYLGEKKLWLGAQAGGDELPGKGRNLRDGEEDFVLRPALPPGYSTELAFWKGVKSLILGAPRHQHTGKVVLFTQESGQWKPKAEVAGTQVGCRGIQSGP